ncbi:MAG: PEP-CTERM sorting domain-containing protein, partial [Sedimentisphaerales bacterium]|nr:PEP-CTERM sorting domain-containing protein [Sedimentisphaerales bacterium]
VQLRAGAGELFVNGVSCGIITPGGAGAIGDGMDIQFGYNNTNLDYVKIIPEPATMLLLSLGGLAALRRRK